MDLLTEPQTEDMLPQKCKLVCTGAAMVLFHTQRPVPSLPWHRLPLFLGELVRELSQGTARITGAGTSHRLAWLLGSTWLYWHKGRGSAQLDQVLSIGLDKSIADLF